MGKGTKGAGAERDARHSLVFKHPFGGEERWIILNQGHTRFLPVCHPVCHGLNPVSKGVTDYIHKGVSGEIQVGYG